MTPSRRIPSILAMLALSFAALASTAVAESAYKVPPPGEAMGVTARGAPSEGASLQAFLTPGKTPDEDMTLRVQLKVPTNQRVCVAFSGFEIAGIKRVVRRGEGRELHEHRCLNNPVNGIVSTSIVVQRRDPKPSADNLFGLIDTMEKSNKNPSNQSVDDFRDGYVIVSVTLDGTPYTFKLTSPRFAVAGGAAEIKKN